MFVVVKVKFWSSEGIESNGNIWLLFPLRWDQMMQCWENNSSGYKRCGVVTGKVCSLFFSEKNSPNNRKVIYRWILTESNFCSDCLKKCQFFGNFILFPRFCLNGENLILIPSNTFSETWIRLQSRTDFRNSERR